MSYIAECLTNIALGAPHTHANLTLFPLLAAQHRDPAYRLLDEAISAGCARVTEVFASGSVPELKFVNDCDLPELLLDGEELVGAKQNRILNLTILAPAGKTILVPVSCVEAGRWAASSDEFAGAGRAHYAARRARKAAQVTESMRSEGSRSSDQSALWADIAAKAARMGAVSETEAAAALYEAHRERLDDYLAAFTPSEEQAGALFAVDGQVTGFDLFDSPGTLKKLLPKLVTSYALDAIDSGRPAPDRPQTGAAEQLLADATAATAECFPAVGEGEDLRLRGERLAGGALMVGGRLLHLCVFRLQEEEGGGANTGPGRMVRASLRRRTRQGRVTEHAADARAGARARFTKGQRMRARRRGGSLRRASYQRGMSRWNPEPARRTR